MRVGCSKKSVFGFEFSKVSSFGKGSKSPAHSRKVRSVKDRKNVLFHNKTSQAFPSLCATLRGVRTRPFDEAHARLVDARVGLWTVRVFFDGGTFQSVHRGPRASLCWGHFSLKEKKKKEKKKSVGIVEHTVTVPGHDRKAFLSVRPSLRSGRLLERLSGSGFSNDKAKEIPDRYTGGLFNAV